MRCTALLWLLALAACDRIFGLDPTHKEGDAAIDSPIGCRTIDPALVSDTFLATANPSTVYGAADGIIVRDTDPALFKFFVGTMIQSNERIVDAKLTLQPFTNINQCHTCAAPTQPFGCYYCMTGYVSWQLYWMTSDWTELGATYDVAKPATPWSGAGAQGPNDRSALVAEGPASTAKPLVLEAGSVETHKVDPTPWVSDTISIELLVTGGQASFNVKDGAGCGPAGPATLELTVCY